MNETASFSERLYLLLERRVDLRDLQVDWEHSSYGAPGFAERALRDLSWQPSPAQTRKEWDLVVEMLDLTPPCRFLDVCCGPGRHVLAMAQQGFVPVGIDSKPEFVEYAREVARRRHFTVDLRVADARDFRLELPCEAAAVFENTLSVIRPEEVSQVLCNIRQALVEKGRFFCDLDNLYRVAQEGLNRSTWFRTPEGFLLQETWFDVETSVQKCRDLGVDLVQERLDEFLVFKRIYTLAELDRLLEEAGFRRTALAGDWDASPYHRESTKMIVAALAE